MTMKAHGLGALKATFATAAVEIVGTATTVLQVGGRKMQQDMRAHAPHGPHTPHYRRAITFDVNVSAGRVHLEVGPDKELPQGPLGNIFEFGGARHPGRPHVAPAGEREVPQIRYHLGAQAAELLR